MKTEKYLGSMVFTILMFVGHYPAPSAIAEWYHSTDTPRRIPAYGTSGTIYSTLNVSDSFSISDIDVQLDITHTFDADLDVYLSHNGVEVELFTDVGGVGSNFQNTVLDDEAYISITAGYSPFAGTYRPEGTLANFDGMDVQGLWRLRITDDYSYDSGYLNSWSISAVPEPATVALLGLGSLCLLRKRRR